MNAIPGPPLLPWAPELSGDAVPPPRRRRAGPPRRAVPAAAAGLAAAAGGTRPAALGHRRGDVRLRAGLHAARLPQRLVRQRDGAAAGDAGELFLLHPQTQALFRPEPMPRVRAYQTLALEAVAQAVPIYLAQSSWRNPVDGSKRALQLVGFDTEAGAVAFPGLAGLVDALKRPDTMAFDDRSRPEFGPIARMLAEHGPFIGQVGNRRVEVIGTVSLGASFGADGNGVVSETNFRRLVKERAASNTDLVALRLRDGADIGAAQARLARLLPGDVVVLTHAELVAWERNYWETATPIGFIFAFGSLMGLIVGMVIVYQILFSDIASHLSEYATLKAMGYANGYLRRAVMGAALILAVLGFIPGLLASIGLYRVVEDATFLPIAMDATRGAIVFGLIFGMCAIAGLLAMRKLRDANPADMF
ncbi:ABC transporter permease DevC [Paeniroseomonas aquatica]|uniref:ABC transporter permease DevC n=1 Tax=Paeniroseomonas aquatica TaxID=373043 RepID=UPI0036136FAB